MTRRDSTMICQIEKKRDMKEKCGSLERNKLRKLDKLQQPLRRKKRLWERRDQLQPLKRARPREKLPRRNLKSLRRRKKRLPRLQNRRPPPMKKLRSQSNQRKRQLLRNNQLLLRRITGKWPLLQRRKKLRLPQLRWMLPLLKRSNLFRKRSHLRMRLNLRNKWKRTSPKKRKMSLLMKKLMRTEKKMMMIMNELSELKTIEVSQLLCCIYN